MIETSCPHSFEKILQENISYTQGVEGKVSVLDFSFANRVSEAFFRLTACLTDHVESS